MNGNGRFKGVNPEYEVVRTDSDGDGLSDRWEKYNNRDPQDGKLQFEFDCGGWQTEGWQASEGLNNIAGFKGFLDFDLLNGQGSISRSGLNLDSTKNKGKLAIHISSSAKTEISVSANGKELGKAVSDSKTLKTVSIALDSNWTGSIKELKIDFSSAKGSTVTIDWIRVQ